MFWLSFFLSFSLLPSLSLYSFLSLLSMTFRKRSLSSSYSSPFRHKKKNIFRFFLFFVTLFTNIFRPKPVTVSIKKYIIRAFLFSLFAVSLAFFWTEFGRGAGKTLVKNTFFALGADLPQDANGLTNILLLGHGGGETHAGKGAKLTDSIIIASLDIEGKSVVMLSVPRDFYVETDHVHGRINEIVREESKYFLRGLKQLPENKARLAELSGQKKKEFLWKLDAQADEKAVQVLRKEIENIFDIDIHRTARIDFRGFENFVDAIGGIDVFVEKTINDPTYPDYEWGYDPFFLKKGQHHLDGKTALKYARSRHGSSDFDRAKRQQKILSAIKTRATSLRVLTSPSKIRNILDVISEYYSSDISWEEMITLGKFADSLPRTNIASFVLNDDPSQPGGFLVTPDRELYGGAFVLVPFLNLEKDKYAQIRAFIRIIFPHRALTHLSPVPITILNGTKRVGIAGKLMLQLERFGWKIADVGNADDSVQKSVIYYADTPKAKKTAELLRAFFNAEMHTKVFPENAEKIDVVLGTSYTKPYRIPLLSLL